MNDEEDIKNIISNVEGWLSDKEGILLFRLARHVNEGNIVEIGSWKGRSTIWLASAAKNLKSHVYAIDPHTGSTEHKVLFGKVDTYGEFLKNIEAAGLSDVVIPVRKNSEDAVLTWSEPIHLLWIDGAHDYNAVLADFKLWSQYLVDGGIMAFHDSTREGAREVVNEVMLKSNSFKCLGIVDSVTFFKKLDKLTIGGRIMNRLLFIEKIIKDMKERIYIIIHKKE